MATYIRTRNDRIEIVSFSNLDARLKIDYFPCLLKNN